MMTHPTPTEPQRYLHSHRVVTAGDRVYVIRETDGSLAQCAPRSQCLVCESAFAVRCAWEYPAEWARLGDADLLKLFR